MDDPATQAAFRRLQSDADLSDATRALVSAALTASETLEHCLAQLPGDITMTAAAAQEPAVSGDGQVFLSRISVSGLRGIADRVDLKLTPRNGLVVVAGRNGSGKSSIAEGAEIALTGRSFRTESTTWWKDGLKNLHHSEAPSTEIAVLVDGVGEVTLTASLSAEQLPALREAIVVASNAVFDLASHGWDDAVGRYRPVLTHTELSDLANSKPKDLFDAIHNIVGLDRLTAADGLLTSAVTDHSRAPKLADAQRKSLTPTLAASGDPRARELEAALKPSKLDLPLARSILAGKAGAGATRRDTLAQWSTIDAPSPQRAAELVAALADAIGRHSTASAGASGRASQLAHILETVLTHREHEEDLCPVCGKGVLDEAWRHNAQERIDEAHSSSTAVRAAAVEVREARRAIHTFVKPLPSTLTGSAVNDVDANAAAAAWVAMTTLAITSEDHPDRDQKVRNELENAVRKTSEAVASLREAATSALDEEDTTWTPIAEQADATVTALEAARDERVRVTELTAARTWFRTMLGALRTERVRQFKEQATSIWADLRQDSNVTLDNITLESATTRRHVELDLAVDGTRASQSVLSQGELAALGLALFLPRSTAPDSPFRFVIVDDPVQSMDPTKVDGLAQVLHKIAEERQVVVFTHDERLLSSLRRLGLPTTAYSVERGRQSAVHLRLVTDAADQYLRDADALAKDSTLPADLIAIAVSGACRDAVETVAAEVAHARLIAAGVGMNDADAMVEHAQTGTKKLLALAILGDANKVGRPLDIALRNLSATAANAVADVVETVHEPDLSRIKSIVSDTRDLLADLRAFDRHSNNRPATTATS